MKKLISLLLVLALALTLVACGGSGAASSSGAKTYKVGVAIYQYNDNFMTLYRQEIENYFKTLETDDVKYEITMVDGKNDMAEQTNQIDTFITQKMDVIICNLVQTSSAEVIIDKVVAADIPLILINREPLGDNGDESYEGIINNPKVCYVGADARQSGTYQGEIVLALPNKGDINGDGVVNYVMVVGDPENPDAQYRTEFSIKALTDAGVKVNELVKNVGNWDQAKGNEIVDAALAQYGKDIEVVFCNNDGMAEGVVASLQERGYNVAGGHLVPVFGVDATDSAKALIADGAMTGTVKQDNVGMAVAIRMTVEAIAAGTSPVDAFAGLNDERFSIAPESAAKLFVAFAPYTG